MKGYLKSDACKYGTLGTKTKITYEDGSKAHVGDVVTVEYDDMLSKPELTFISKAGGEIFACGIRSYKENILNGKTYNGEFKIKLIKKYTELENGETHSGITVVLKPEKEKIMKFEDLKQGDKLTLRDDLVDGERYNGITYSDRMYCEQVVVKKTTPAGNILSTDDWYYSPQMFKELTQNQGKPNPKNQLKKSESPNQQAQSDPFLDKPIVEVADGGYYIFSGRTTIYISEELSGVWGMSSCSPQDYRNGLYNKRTGKALAYHNAYEERSK